MSQESQVNVNFVDYDRLGLRLFAISISPQSEEKQVWPVGCLRAGCKIGRNRNGNVALFSKIRHCALETPPHMTSHHLKVEAKAIRATNSTQ